MNVNLTGANAEHYAYGLSMTQHGERVENDILIVHASPCCQSKQLFKHILSDTSVGAFTGRTVVSRDAQKTMAYQRSSNILLHPEARMNIRPQLEIYADDVKCSHGATVGQLDAEALFYMRSRGISETEAKKMLLQAFAGEVTDDIACKQFREKMVNKEFEVQYS
jgi:Fe-S cluster assembly protein SufD